MKTFEEYQALANTVPVSLRNDRDRVDLPVLGLQDEAGKLGSLLSKAFASGTFTLTEDQSEEVRDRLGDVLWYLALLCRETGINLQALAAHSATQLTERSKGFDTDRR